MTSEVNENKIARDSSQPQSLELNNNPDIVSNGGISSSCNQVSKFTSSYDGEKSRDELISTTTIRDNRLVHEIDKCSDIFAAIKRENTSACKTHKAYNQKNTSSDKYPSRWASEMSGYDIEPSDTIQNQDNSVIQIKPKNYNLQTLKESKTNFTLANKICDQECTDFSLNCDKSSVTFNSKNLYPLGGERENIGKEAIEELASELNKAATTIQDFAQSVSLTRSKILIQT